MVILGISGFEDSNGSGSAHPYASRRREAAASKGGAQAPVPLQFFPLHLIGHDSAAALIVDGKVIACAAEERFTRIKHGFNLAGKTVLPRRAMRYCLDNDGAPPPGFVRRERSPLAIGHAFMDRRAAIEHALESEPAKARHNDGKEPRCVTDRPFIIRKAVADSAAGMAMHLG